MPAAPLRTCLSRILTAALSTLALSAAHATAGQDPYASPPTQEETFEPSIGQAGKDVIWVPTGESLVEQMLNMAQVTPKDYLVDLGSGDGRTVIAAAKRGARAHGIEYNPDMVALSRQAAKKAGVSDKATFEQGDIFESDFSDATVVTLFLLPNLNLRLRPILLDMTPGTRVVSNSFTMGDWRPDESYEKDPNCDNFCRAYKWVVPAKVAGQWQLDNQASLDLTQHFQELSGHLTLRGVQHPIQDARLDGARIAFSAAGLHYTGEVQGDQIVGKVDQGETWKATRRP